MKFFMSIISWYFWYTKFAQNNNLLKDTILKQPPIITKLYIIWFILVYGIIPLFDSNTGQQCIFGGKCILEKIFWSSPKCILFDSFSSNCRPRDHFQLFSRCKNSVAKIKKKVFRLYNSILNDSYHRQNTMKFAFYSSEHSIAPPITSFWKTGVYFTDGHLWFSIANKI